MNNTLKIISIFIIAVVVVSIMTFGLFKGSDDANAFSKEEIEQIVKEYIMNNPQIIIDSLTQHQLASQSQEQAKSLEAIAQNRELLENDPNTPFMGDPDADVVIVEFFDYSCGYCKKVMPYLTQLLKEDPNLRIAFKEYPILGQNSLVASKAAIAAFLIDESKYFDFHNALMSKRVSGVEAVLKTAAEAGYNKDAIAKKMGTSEVEKIINDNRQLADTIGVRGTPAFTINGEFIPGALDYDGFKSYIDQARAN